MIHDIDSLWDFGKPEISEQRFRAALVHARGDEALVLQTQIARSHGLRRDFARAQALLTRIAADVQAAGPEVQVRHALEWGRTLASAAHPPDSQTTAAQDQAHSAYLQAFQIASAAGLDGLAIDTLHMLAFVDTAPADQVKWGQAALAIVEASTQPAAKKWEASLRNNVGYALHQLQRYEDALQQFKLALAIRERGNDAEAIRIAHWMVAWTLRALGQHDQALEIQERLERECDAADAPDLYVFEELEILYRDRNDTARADHYVRRQKTT